MIDFKQMEPLMMNWHETDTMQARILMSAGLHLVSPDFIMPQLNLEPFTKAELLQIWGYKKGNISKLRSIIRKAKNTWH